MKRVRLTYPYIFVWMPIFIVAPMLFVLYYATFKNGSFTLDYIKQVFTTSNYLPALWTSIWIALVTTAICLIIGYPVAYILSTMKKRTAALVSLLFIMPMWMNMLLRTFAWKIVLDKAGVFASVTEFLTGHPAQILYTPTAVLIATIYDFLPFMILPLYTTLMKMDRSHVEAARDLGANGFQTFTKVILPLSVPGIISGITMVFVPAMSTFAVSRMLGGGKVKMIGEVIERKIMEQNDPAVGSTLSILLIILVLISMAIMNKVDKENSSTGGTLW